MCLDILSIKFFIWCNGRIKIIFHFSDLDIQFSRTYVRETILSCIELHWWLFPKLIGHICVGIFELTILLHKSIYMLMLIPQYLDYYNFIVSPTWDNISPPSSVLFFFYITGYFLFHVLCFFIYILEYIFQCLLKKILLYFLVGICSKRVNIADPKLLPLKRTACKIDP